MEQYSLAPLLTYAVEAAGGRLLFAGQEDQLRLVNEKKYASATPDGIAINLPRNALQFYGIKDIGPSRQVFAEMKSIDPRFREGNLPKDQHVDQVNFAMGLARGVEAVDPVSGEVLTIKADYGLLVYQDASDYAKISVFVVKFDAEVFKHQLVRAKTIMEADTPEGLRPEGKVSGGAACKYCEFSNRCLGYSALVPRVISQPPAEVVSKLKTAAQIVQDFKKQAADADKNAKLAEADLKEMLIDAGTKFVEAPGLKLAWSTSDGRKMTDNKAIAAALLKAAPDTDMTQFEKTSKGSDTLRIDFVDTLATA